MKKSIPNILTASNLFCGCLALFYIFRGEADMTAIMIGVALIMDFLDGFVARILGVSSPVGKELDSLADAVSFGVVPGFILFRMLADTQSIRLEAFQPWSEDAWILVGLLVAIFSAVRLAKFNLDERQSDAFFGLPTPANTILILSLWLIVERVPDHPVASFFQQSPTLIVLSLVSSYMLVADVKLIALKFKNFAYAGNQARYWLIGLSLLLLAIFGLPGVPFIVVAYLLLSLADNAGIFGKK